MKQSTGWERSTPHPHSAGSHTLALPIRPRKSWPPSSMHFVRFLKTVKPDGLGIVGGETAYHVLERLGARRLEVFQRQAEVIACSRIVDGVMDGRRFVMQGRISGARGRRSPNAFPSHRKEGLTMKPILGITMGDAAGIGPEIILKSFRAHRRTFRSLPSLGDWQRGRNAILRQKTWNRHAHARHLFAPGGGFRWQGA